MKTTHRKRTTTSLIAIAVVLAVLLSPAGAMAQTELPPEAKPLVGPAAPEGISMQPDAVFGPAAVNALITVNTSADENTANASCSLREAIIAANTNAAYNGCPTGSGAVVDEVNFSAGVTQINLTGELPTITERVTVNGFSAALNRILLNATALAAGADVFQISANDVSIHSLQIYNLAPGGGRAIYLQSGTNTQIYFNYIGVTEAASNCSNGGVTRASNYGVALGSASSGATVFGNIIGCNTGAGVFINGSNSHRIGTAGVNNLIGIKDDLAVPNGIGVWLNNSGANGASNNVVQNNRIAGNTGDGIRISGTGTNDATSSASNTIIGNRIGINAAGNAALPNGVSGIRLVDGAYLNTIGGPDANDRNIISGNQVGGIQINNSNGNNVLGNFIGVTLTGTEELNNAGTAIAIFNGEENNIGCTSFCGVRKGNRISANTSGIYIDGGTRNLIAANEIGFAPGGLLGIDLGSGNSGIFIRNGASRTVVGSVSNPAWANIIAYNKLNGVSVDGSNTTTNTIGINTIFGNALQGISLTGGTRANIIKGTTIVSNGLGGSTQNYDGISQEAGTTGNRWSEVSINNNGGLGIDILADDIQSNVVTNPGVTFTEVKLDGPNISFKGHVANITFTGVREVEVYEVALDASGFGEGARYVGTDTLDASGNFELSVAGTSVKCYTAFVTYYPSVSGDDYSTEFSRSSCAVHMPIIAR
jgi:CSLREA domain-containing protein